MQRENRRALETLTGDPRYADLHAKALAILEDRSRIPYGALRDGLIYNFWQDDQHVRGLWRCTLLASYVSPMPQWETLLDVDALAAAEAYWVYKGVECPPGNGPRCLISLSDGGQDAVVVAEIPPARPQFRHGRVSRSRKPSPTSPGRTRIRCWWPPTSATTR